MSLVPESFLKIRLKKFELKLLTDLINWYISGCVCVCVCVYVSVCVCVCVSSAIKIIQLSG